jgi:hypothetical protein
MTLHASHYPPPGDYEPETFPVFENAQKRLEAYSNRYQTLKPGSAVEIPRDHSASILVKKSGDGYLDGYPMDYCVGVVSVSMEGIVAFHTPADATYQIGTLDETTNISFGRSAPNEESVERSIVCLNPTVSQVHAVVIIHEGKLFIRLDENISNQTSIAVQMGRLFAPKTMGSLEKQSTDRFPIFRSFPPRKGRYHQEPSFAQIKIDPLMEFQFSTGIHPLNALAHVARAQRPRGLDFLIDRQPFLNWMEEAPKS